MVCITALKLAKRLGMQLKATEIRVTYDASQINGTSAQLREDDVLTLWDLLFGLMLPSGNDAGYLIAEYFGRALKKAGKTRITKKIKLDPDSSPLESLTDGLDTTKSKEASDEESMVIDETEKSKYLHKFSQFKYSYVKYFIMEMNYYAREDFK